MNSKKILCLFIFIFLIGCGCIEFDLNSNVNSSNLVEIKNKGNFTSISEAIEFSSDGDVLILHPGIYYESFIVNKSISVVGKDRENVIIQYPESNDNDVIINVKADDCILKNFTIKYKESSEVIGLKISSSNNEIENLTIYNTIHGIYLLVSSANNYIINNNLFFNDRYGIWVSRSSFNTIYSNNISNNKYGIEVYGDSKGESIGNIILENFVSSNEMGIHLKDVSDNNVVRNVISDNEFGVYVCCGSENNSIYYNSFLGNLQQSYLKTDTKNYWYSKNRGNYWDDYTQKYPDANKLDDIWDIPYVLDGISDQADLYPLVDPLIN
jgi:parallel beta-helix repeat protein